MSGLKSPLTNQRPRLASREPESVRANPSHSVTSTPSQSRNLSDLILPAVLHDTDSLTTLKSERWLIATSPDEMHWRLWDLDASGHGSALFATPTDEQVAHAYHQLAQGILMAKRLHRAIGEWLVNMAPDVFANLCRITGLERDALGAMHTPRLVTVYPHTPLM